MLIKCLIKIKIKIRFLSFLFRSRQYTHVRWPTLPCWSPSISRIMETKKTWEYVSRVLIPAVRPSHCPLMRISNVKPAHTSDDIYTHHGMDSQGNDNDNVNDILYIRKDSITIAGIHLIIYIKGMIAAGRYKINPRERFLLHYRCIKIQICEV